MRIGQTSVIYFLSQIAAQAISFIALLLFSRWLGTEIVGFYFLALTIVSWFSLFGKMGITSATTKRISEGTDKSEFFSAAGIIFLCTFIIISLIIIFGSEIINDYVGAQVSFLIVLLMFANLFLALVNSTLRGEHLVHVSGILNPIETLSKSTIQLGLVVAGCGLSGMLFGFSVGGIISGILGLYFIRSNFSTPEYEHVKSLISFAKYSWIGNIQGRTFRSADILVLGLFVPAAEVGVYSIAWMIALFLSTFSTSISRTIFPEISKLSTESAPEKIGELMSDSLRYAGLIVLPGFAGAFVLGDMILGLFGPSFVNGYNSLLILIAGILFYGYLKQIMNVLKGAGLPDVAFYISIAYISVNIVFNIILISIYGKVGAAIATTISAAVGLVLAGYSLSQYNKFQIPMIDILNQLSAATIMGAFVYALRYTIETLKPSIPVEIHLGLLFCLGAAVYFAIMLYLSNRFRETVLRNLQTL